MRRALISGAGIAGLTLAWWLHHDGWQVQLVEQASSRRSQGYMIDFFGSGYDVAERMVLIPELRRIRTRITALCYVDPGGRPIGLVDTGRIIGVLDNRAMTFMRGSLEEMLYRALDDQVPIRYAATVEAAKPGEDGTSVRLSDGFVTQVDLIVGADGIHSRMRELAFGPQEHFLRYLGYHTASYLIDDADLRRRVGERFLVVAVPGRQFGLYPTNDGPLAAWMVHHAPDPAMPPDPQAAVTAIYCDLGPVVAQALYHCPTGRDLYYDQVAQIAMPAWSRGSTTLIGDACLAVSLMAGQGASLAMGSAWALADELRFSASIPESLTRYEKRMRPFIEAKQKTGRNTAKWLVPNTSGAITLRRIGMAAARLPGAGFLLRPVFRSMAGSVVPR